MHGNVWEWCEDWYQTDLGKEAVSDPLGAETGDFRVLRGGSWFTGGRNCRSAGRSRDSPDDRFDSIGFRLSLGLEHQTGRWNRKQQSDSQPHQTRRDVANAKP